MANYQLIVGNEDCPFKTVIPILRQSTVLQRDWFMFALQLDVPSEQIKRLKQEFLHDKISFGELILEVLEIWKGKHASNATLANLLEIIEKHCGANDIGEILRLECKLPCKEADANPSIGWKGLSPAFQTRVIQSFQHFFPNLKPEQVLPKLNGETLVSLMRGENPHIQSHPEALIRQQNKYCHQKYNFS